MEGFRLDDSILCIGGGGLVHRALADMRNKALGLGGCFLPSWLLDRKQLYIFIYIGQSFYT